MKKVLLVFCLMGFLGCSGENKNQPLTKQTQNHPNNIEKRNYSIVLDDLNDKTVLRGLYSKLFEPILVGEGSDLSDEKEMHVGIFIENNPYIAIYRNTQKYHNIDGEERFLVHVERRPLTKEDNDTYSFSETCGACTSNDDLFIFKKLENGKFGLLSKTDKSFETPGRYGISQFDINDLEKRVEKITESANGFFYIFGSSMGGNWEGYRGVMVLNEDKPILNYYVDIAETNSEAEYGNSALSTAYESTVKVLQSEKTTLGFYPLEVKFSGDTTDDNGNFEKYNKIKKYIKNRDGNSYKEISSKDY